VSIATLFVVTGPALVSRAIADDFATCRDASGDAAIAACTRAISSGRLNVHDLAVTYYNRSGEYGRKGDIDRAIADSTEAIRLAPHYPAALTNRGTAYHAKGDDDRAIADFNEAIRLDPTYEDAFVNRANAFQAKGDTDRAIADLTEAIRLDPKDAIAYNNRANMYARKNDYDRAIADYDQAIKLNPNLAQANENRARAIASKNHSSAAQANIPEGDVWNTGSVFAAGTQCEMKGFMAQGQTVPLLAHLLQGISTKDGQRINDGYHEGLKRTAIYSKNFGRWVPYPLTAEGCSQVQYAITQYKAGLDTIDSNR